MKIGKVKSAALAQLLALALAIYATDGRAADDMTKPIRVSPDGHFLTQPDGMPFFWLGDTAWELFCRLDRDETDRYLRDRARKGFNVIQVVASGKLDPDGLKLPNRYGEAPFIDGDPARPNEKYFEHVDWVVNRAAEYGIRIALLPLWGAIFISGAPVFDAALAEQYGRWLAQRYRSRGIIWVLGGDTNPLQYVVRTGTDEYQRIVDTRPIYDAMARGISAGESGDPFITYHPSLASPLGSALPRMSLYFGDRDWFDMSMLQTSHHSDANTGALKVGFMADSGPLFMWNATYNYVPVEDEYSAVPVRPAIDGEPRYEDSPRLDYNVEAKSYWRARDARNAIYQALFAGAAGHTYGNFNVWDFHDPTRRRMEGPYERAFAQYTREPWQQALDAHGAGQMQYAKTLMMSRPYFSRIPDQSLIIGEAGAGEAHIGATRDRSGAYVMVYLPQGQPVTVDLSKLSGTNGIGWWFDPRSGKATRMEGTLPSKRPQRFAPPTSGPDQDWVLILDDAANNFSIPGSATSAGRSAELCAMGAERPRRCQSRQNSDDQALGQRR